jgi:hypothetical protein
MRVRANSDIAAYLATHVLQKYVGTLQNPFGHVWTLATHVEDVQPEEMSRRAEKYMQQKAKN